MELNIRDSETHRLARRLAALTGETLTGAVREAVRQRLRRVERMRENASLADELDRIALYCAGLPVRDSRSAEEILGHDDRGLPT